jgi:Flp pilus assembly protein TadD
MSDRSPTSTDARGRRRLVVVIVGALAIFPYLNALGGDFTFDDLGVIVGNPMISGANASAVGLMTTARYLGEPLYRPLTMLSYLANARLSGVPVGYHLVNLCLHVLVTLAVFRLAEMLLESALAATVTAALFAVHPLHTEAVTNIVGRAELLATLLVLASLLASARAGRLGGGAGRRWVFVSLAALVAALLAKESALAAVPLSAIVQLWARPASRARERVAICLLYGLLAVAYLLLRLLLVGALTLPVKPDLLDNPLAHVSVLPRLATALVIVREYLAALVFPLCLSADYSFNQIPVVTSLLDRRLVGAVAVFVALAAMVVVGWRRAPALPLAAAFMFVPLALTANVFFPIGTIKAERLMYLPSFGWCLAWGWFVMRWSRGQRQWCLWVVVLVVSAYAGRTWMRNRDWQNNFTLFSAAVRTSPRSAKAHHNLAVTYDERGEAGAAMLHFHRALAIDPAYGEAAFGIGRIYQEKGLDGAALYWYAQATKLDWRLAQAHLNAGAIHYHRGDVSAAESAFRAGLESAPDDARLLVGLSLALVGQGRNAQARAVVERTAPLVQADPAMAEQLAAARRALEERDVQ